LQPPFPIPAEVADPGRVSIFGPKGGGQPIQGRKSMCDRMLDKWRADTPGCLTRAHLNNAGAGLMPMPVIRAIHNHIDLEAQIGGYEAADMEQARIEKVYHSIASLIGTESRNVAIVGNATAGFIQSISSFDFDRGDVILTTKADYTSYQIQYLSLARRLGLRIVYAEEFPEGGVDPQSVRELIKTERPRLVHVSWIPTHSGMVQDVERVGEVCKELDVPYLVDACQAVGQLPIDVSKLHCDYLSVTARKFLRGPRGVGFMYASDRALARGDYPLFVDMRGARWVQPNRFEIAQDAKRYEDWEFPYALVLGLGAAVDYALEVGIDVAHSRSMALATLLRGRLAELDGVTLLDRGRENCAIVTADIRGWKASDVVGELLEMGINTSATLRWYGLKDFENTAVQSALRLSPLYYNTEGEVKGAVQAISDILNQPQ
jgi:selenocysteine lyase/cysteine desulfurase